MTIKITSDSTCDLSKELVAKYNIGIIPLYVVKDGVSLKDGLEITPEDIFAFTDSTGKLCTTAAVSQYDYTETFRPLSEQYDAVIHITISADFSSCYQNACAAAEEFPNVYVVDSRNLSTGHGHIVIEAAQLAEQGLAPEEICARLNDLTGRVEASFLLPCRATNTSKQVPISGSPSTGLPAYLRHCPMSLHPPDLARFFLYHSGRGARCQSPFRRIFTRSFLAARVLLC